MDDFVFIRANLQPVGGWRYVDPNTSFQYGPHNSLEDLASHVEQHRRAKSLPALEGLSQKVHNYQASLPENRFLYTKLQRSRTVGDYANGVMNAKAIFSQKEFVDDYEAERRARICALCPYNDEMQLTAADKIIDGRVLQKVRGKTTGYDNSLKHCRICKCLLRAKVWFKKEVIQGGLTPEIEEKLPRDGSILNKKGQPFTCWQTEK